MEPPASPTKRPATPQSHIKSLFTAASSCTSASSIQITPPSASRTNLFSVTRPFPEEETQYTSEESQSGLRRTLSSPIRRAKDALSSNSQTDTESQDEHASPSKSHHTLGLRKSPSWSVLFSPSKSHKFRHRKEPNPQDGLTTDEDEREEEGDTTTGTRRARSPFKGQGRANNLKERALGLIRGGKRGSFSSPRGDAVSPSKDVELGRDSMTGQNFSNETGSTTPAGTPIASRMYARPSNGPRSRSTPSPTPASTSASTSAPSTSIPVAFPDPSPKKSTTPSPRRSTTPSPRKSSANTPSPIRLPQRPASALPVLPVLEPNVSTPKPFGTATVLGDGTLGPAGSLRRGILKLAETPGSGRSVRFGSRNAYRILTPTSPTTSFTSNDQLGSNLFSLHKRGGTDDKDDDGSEDEAQDASRRKVGLESSVSAVGRGRPPINRMGSASSSSSTGSTGGNSLNSKSNSSAKSNPINESPSRRMSKKSSIEEKLKELYLVGKKTIESASSSSSIADSDNDEQMGAQDQWSGLGTTLDLPSEGAFEGSEYTDFLLEDKRMEGLLPGESPISSREQPSISERTVQAEAVGSSSTTSTSKSTNRRSVSLTASERERNRIMLSIHEKQRARAEEESTVLGLLGDRTGDTSTSRRSSDTFGSRGSPSSRRNSSFRLNSNVTTTPKTSPPARRVSSASKRNISMRNVSTTSDRSSFDVLSHYGDESMAPASKQTRISSGNSANLTVDSPNLSRWSPDTTGEDPSRSRSVSLSTSEARNSRTEASLADESDRSVGVMIVHEDQPSNASGELYEAFQDGSESMKDGTSMDDKASVKSSPLRRPSEVNSLATSSSSGTSDRSGNMAVEVSVLPATPEKGINADKTMFWTPGSVFQDLSLSQLASPPSDSPATGETLTRSIVSLGHALIAAEDEFIDQLKAEIQRWKDIAQHLHKKAEAAESKSRNVTQTQVSAQGQSPRSDSALDAKCSQLAAELDKIKDEKREAEIQLEGMQRHYWEAKEREERWQARYELVKHSWEAEKQEKEELAVRMRDEEIKRQGVDTEGESTVPALRLEIERLNKQNAQQITDLQSMAAQLEEQRRQPGEQEAVLRAHALSLEAHLEEQRVEANTRLKALAKDNSTLKKQRDDLHEHRLDLETALDALRAERSSVQKLQKRLTRKQADLDTERTKLESDLDTERATMQREHQQAIKERDDTLERYQAECRTSEEKCRSLIVERDASLSKADELSREMDQIVKQATEIEQQHARLADEMDLTRQRIEALLREKEDLLVERDNACKAREVALTDCATLLEERDDALKRTGLLETQLEEQKQSAGASKSAKEEMLGAAQRELQQRRAEESHYQRLVESLEEDLARSEAALAKIKAETQTVVEKSRLVEQQLAQTHEGHEQELKAARENFGILDKEYDGLKEDNATLMIELEKMHSLLADTNRSAAASTETETALHARIQSLVTDIETLKKSISSLRQENSTKDNQIERLQRAREQLKDDKEMLNIALDSKQQEVELLRRKYGDGRQSTHTPIDQLGESISTTPAASRLAASVRRHTANRRPSATSMTTPLPNQRALGRGTPSTINATRRFPSIPKSLNTPVDVSHVLNSSVKFNRKASLGLASARRSTSMTSSKRYDRGDQESQSLTTEAEYRAMSLVPSLEAV